MSGVRRSAMNYWVEISKSSVLASCFIRQVFLDFSITVLDLVTCVFTFMDTVHFGLFLGIGVQIIISNFCYSDTASGK